MKQKDNELYVITSAKELGNYIFTITEKSPKKFRFSLITKLQQLSIEMIENLYRANMIYVRDKKDHVRVEKRQLYQREAYVSLKLLNYFAWLSREQQCILPKQQEQIAKKTAEVQRLLVAWAKSDQRKQG